MVGRILRIAGRVAAVPAKEGAFGAPDGQVIAHLQQFISAKYTIDVAYRNFADRVHGPWRDSLVDHWYKHAEEERKNTYDLTMKVVAMGGDPVQTMIQVPPCTPNVAALMQVLVTMELDAIEAGRVLCTLAGDNTALRLLGEESILLDTQHLDDLRRMMAKIDMK